MDAGVDVSSFNGGPSKNRSTRMVGLHYIGFKVKLYI